MAGEDAPTSKGLSLYANLLDNDTPGTITSAPVTYGNIVDTSEHDEGVKKQQGTAASIRFQPTKRPLLAAQKAKAKAIASKLSGLSSTVHTDIKQDIVEPIQNAPKLSAADWTATLSEDEDINAYTAGTRTRGGKRRKKKTKESGQIEQNWNDIYDPSRPNNYEEYKHSEEKVLEVREWKDLLYRQRMKRRSNSLSSEQGEKRPMNREEMSSKPCWDLADFPGQFAPPLSFAPPSSLMDDYSPPPAPPSATAHAAIPSGEDAYLRRMQISSAQTARRSSPPPSDLVGTGQIARAPVRYNLPPAPTDLLLDDTEVQQATPEDDPAHDTSRSNRPGQKGFAERLLTKYGWTKGSGLGAQGQGIINPLYAKADKRKKKSDAEGGGYATPAGTGKILGGDKGKQAQRKEEGKFGAMSEVIKLDGMLDGMDVQTELTKIDGDGSGLMQEIGEECGEKYGSVERVFVHVPEGSGDAVVFVRFVSQLSALRAVNALDGRVFNGNTIRAQYWDREKFDDGIYV